MLSCSAIAKLMLAQALSGTPNPCTPLWHLYDSRSTESARELLRLGASPNLLRGDMSLLGRMVLSHNRQQWIEMFIKVRADA